MAEKMEVDEPVAPDAEKKKENTTKTDLNAITYESELLYRISICNHFFQISRIGVLNSNEVKSTSSAESFNFWQRRERN